MFKIGDRVKVVPNKNGDYVISINQNTIVGVLDKDKVTQDVFVVERVYKIGSIYKLEKLDGVLFGESMLELVEEVKKEKPKLTEDEKVILRNINKELKYIVRESFEKHLGDGLSLCNELPRKDYVHGYWINNNGLWCSFNVFSHLFQSIKWEDNEPYSIEELLKESE